jgi:HNH endonuclease
MDAAVRARVLRRAGNRCEYCLLRQEQLPFSTFHIEHIIPRKHGGDDEPANLALACDRCNSPALWDLSIRISTKRRMKTTVLLNELGISQWCRSEVQQTKKRRISTSPLPSGWT